MGSVMNRLASEIIGRGVIVRQETVLIGHIQEIVINPEDGRLAGLIIKEGFGKGKLKAVAEKDMLGLNEKFVLISSYSALGDLDEIVRIKNILDLGIKIKNCKVQTISGIVLGKTVDYSVDFKLGKLSRLYVNPKNWRKITKQHIIDSKCIIRIEKDKIIVDDTCLKEKKGSGLRAATVAKELSLN